MTEPVATFKQLHPGVASILRYFEYDHLPEHLQSISRRCSDVAIVMAVELDGPELTAGLRKLLEAKDCFVRAALDKPQTSHLEPRKEGHMSEQPQDGGEVEETESTDAEQAEATEAQAEDSADEATE